jgi:hypothetical protein
MMSEEKYPDIIELKLKTCFSDAQKIDQMEKKNLKKKVQGPTISSSDQNDERRVKKYIEISEEALNAIVSGKYVTGTLHRDPNGWVMESAERIKFFNSVDKEIGQRMIEVTMYRDVKTGMQALAKDRILAGESLCKNECATKQ